MARTREYDEAALLDGAMETFWTLGYEQTSVEKIVARTGVHRASLYSAYPDKRALFLAGMQHYLDSVVEENIRRLHQVSPAGEAVRQFFLGLVEAPMDRLRRGCLMVNAAVQAGEGDPDVAALVRKAFRRVERALQARLVEAQQANELRAGIEPEALARLLITVLQGVRVMSRVATDRDTIRDAVSAALYWIVPRQRRGRKMPRRAAKPRAPARGHG